MLCSRAHSSQSRCDTLRWTCTMRLSRADDIGLTIALSCAVARPDDNRACGQQVFADAPLVNQAVERLLHLMRAGVQFIEKEAVRFRARDHAGRAEAADALD